MSADANIPRDPTTTPTVEVEQDSRFPSGKWVGFFLQPQLPGKHPMELILTFTAGTLKGEGRDWVGSFVMKGRYETDSGKCWWTKSYIGKHEIAYQGYNEGKGIWGTWQYLGSTNWKGGFRIWPEGMPDPTQPRMSEAVEAPESIEEPASELDAVMVPVPVRRERRRRAE